MANGTAAGDASSGSLQPLTAAVAEAQVAASRSASLSEACSRTLQGVNTLDGSFLGQMFWWAYMDQS